MNIVTIEGNIGCTKSTSMEYLHINYRIPVDLENVEKWQPYLEDMYYNRKNTFEFQIRVWLDRCWIQSHTHTTPMLMERSPFFQREVFVQVIHENGSVTDREYANLIEMYNRSMSTWSPQGYIYLRSDPHKCYERIQKRGRKSEEAISIDYLQKLHDKHELAYQKALDLKYNVHVIDVEDKTTQEITDEILKALNKIGWKKIKIT